MTTPHNPYETRPAPSSRSEGLEIAALVFAIVMPLVGLILALVALSKARKSATPTSGVLKAALIVAGILTGAGLILGFYVAWLMLGALFGWSFAFQNADTSATEPPPPGIVMAAAWANGSTATDTELAAARTLLDERLERTGITAEEFHFGEGVVRITFPDDVDTEELERAAKALSADIRLDFRQVFASMECDPATGHPVSNPSAQIALCDRDRAEQLVLAPSELTGASIVDAYASELTTAGVSSGNWAVTIVFDSEGTQTLTTLTERLFALDLPINRFAIVLDGELLTAPTVNAVITSGEAQITGPFIEEQARSLANDIMLAARGLDLRVKSLALRD